MERAGAREALSRAARRLEGRGARRGDAGDAALRELGALLEAADGACLCEPGGPEVLAQVARALEACAAPARDGDGEGEGEGGGGPARAAEAGRLLLRLLRAVEAAGPAAGRPGLRALAGPAFVFAATHRLERAWGGPGARRVAADVLAQLLRAAGRASVAALLRGEAEDDEGAFAAVLRLLEPRMSKGSWKDNPATKHVFSWSLQQVTRPWLARHLERTLPPALLLSDDYQTEHKVLGVRCLRHIVLNVPAADLLQYNRAEVIYHAVSHHLYTPDHLLIQAVVPCLLDLFPVLERALQWKGGAARPSTHCDEVLRLLLTHMEPEHRLLLRRAYAGSLPAFVERLGILSVRHLKRLERVIIGYLEVYDGPEEEARLKILETLKLLLRHTWPRVSCRLVVLLKALLKLICDVARDQSLTPEPVKSELLREATDCLILLDHCSQGQVKGLLAKALQSCEDSTVASCLRRVQQTAGDTPRDGT